MHNSPKEPGKRKRSRMVLSFTMAMIMAFSSAINVFAQAAWPGNFLVYSASFNGGNTILATSGQFNNIPDTYQNVPVDSTFTLSFGGFKVFLFRDSWDPNTGTFSSTLNRDLVEIQDSQGNKVSDVTVSNENDANNNTSGNDANVNVHPNKSLDYDTNYKLVLKKYFSKSNQSNPPMIRGAVPEDVVIPFKTEALPKPTLTKAELRGNTLTLEGLPKNQKLEYNLAVDGNFQDSNWKAFDYTDDTASIGVSSVSLAANSKIKIGYAKNDNSTPDDVSDPISVFYASTSGPSFSGAVLNGNNLVLNGLPKNTVGIEYSIAADGQNYSDWKDLSVTGTLASVSVDGLNLVEGQSIIKVRYKASAPWSASDVTQNSFVYALGATAPLDQGKDTLVDQGIKINSVSLNTPVTGEANTVTVRNAKGEKLPAPDGMTSMGFDGGEDDYDCSGTYGFTLKGSGVGDNNHVKITIPYQLPTVRPKDVPDSAVIDDSKVGMYMLTSFHRGDSKEQYQYWKYVPATIDAVNHTATVDISEFDTKGKDVILSARFDSFAPRNLNLQPYARTATTLSFSVTTPDYSPVKSVVITRVNHADPSDVKKVTLDSKDYPGLADPFFQHTIYTDTDPKPGVNYDYTISDATDIMGNDGGNTYTMTCSATIDSMEQLVQESKDAINKSLQQINNNNDNIGQIVFAPGDSQNSVTQQILLPTEGIVIPYGNITWTSSRPDILKVGDNGSNTEIHPPVDANGNPIKDGVTVTLTGTIKYSITDSVTHQTETATGTVTVPLTVKWNMLNGEVIIDNEFLHKANMVNDSSNIDPTIDINGAAKFDSSIANTILLKHTTVLSYKDVLVPDQTGVGYPSHDREPQDYVIDAKGKTIKADFDGALFSAYGNSGGSFTLKNAVIDMNHKSGSILNVTEDYDNIIFDNVKIINAENCQYGVLLESINSFTANNCEFPSFKTAAISIYNTHDYAYTVRDVDINNCTFDGGRKPGYAVLDAYGNVNINNSTFKGYKGNVSTGWNTSNDSYGTDYAVYDQGNIDADGNKYHAYMGIPDGSPSAAILVKEIASANLKGNTITDSDNSVLAWTGEKNFSFVWKKPAAGFTAYPTVNGIKVDSTTAAQVVDSVLNSNTIVGAKDSSSNQVLVQDAADRYNRTTLLAKTGAPDTTAPTWDSISKVEASKVTESSLTLNWSGASDNLGVTSYNIYKDGTLIGSVDGNATSYNVTGLNPYTEYTFKVEAVDGGNNTAAGPSTKVKTVDTTAPTWSVTNTAKTSNVTENSATVSWDKAQDNVGVTAYRIYKNDVLATTVDGNTTSYNAIGLNPYTAYVFKIEAVDASNNVSATTLTAKVNVFDTAAPTWSASSSVKASKITENSLTLTWDTAQDNVAVKSYKIYKDGTVIGTVDGNTTSYDVAGLNQNTEYTFKVEAVDGGDNSSTTGPSAKVKTVEKVITDSSTGITVKGNIPAGAAKISVEAIADPSKIAELDKSLSSATTKTETYKTAAAYDLSLLDSSNAKIQPNGTVTISIPLDAGIANKDLAVFYVDDKGVATEMPSNVANGAITFTTTHFSQYVIAEVVPVTPADTTTNSGNGNGGTTGTPAGGNTTGTTNTDNGTAATNTNAAGSTGTTTALSTASGTTSGTGSTASTNSTSTDGNVANPKTGNSVKSILPIFIAAIIAMAGLVLVEIRRKRLN